LVFAHPDANPVTTRLNLLNVSRYRSPPFKLKAADLELAAHLVDCARQLPHL
jgi:hypothetical protein